MPNAKGHNVGRTVHTKLLVDAANAVTAFSSALEQAISRTRIKQYEALAAIYRLYVTLRDWPEAYADFYAQNGINPDSRSKYPAQPIVRFVTHSATRDVRVKASFWSGAIAWAERQQIKPDDFIEFIKSCQGGIDGAYRAESAARKGKDERSAALTRLIEATDAFISANPAAAIPSLPLMKNLESGKYLLIAEVDDEGNIAILARLDRSFENVESTFDEHVTNWYARSKGTSDE